MGIGMTKRSAWPVAMIVLLAATHAGFAADREFSAQSRSKQQAARAELTQEPTEPSYVLGPSDRVRLKVYGEQDITGEYEVDTNGYISVPLAGRVKAAGLNTRQLEKAGGAFDLLAARAGEGDERVAHGQPWPRRREVECLFPK